MKKFLFILLLLILIGGAGFFFGWVKFTVPPGSYGVMRSKTHGLDSQIIRDGEFRWIWYKLIPTNVEISVYTLEPVKYSVQSSGNLNSGQIYAELAGLEVDFSWEISGDLGFSLRPEILPELTARENIGDNEALKKYGEVLASRIGSFVIQRLNSYSDGDILESIMVSGSNPALNSEIERAFPEIENLYCSLRVIRLPDFALYQSAKALYRDYLAQQSSVLRPDTLAEAEKRIQVRMRMDELTRYGELLTKYPILLQYLTLENSLPE